MSTIGPSASAVERVELDAGRWRLRLPAPRDSVGALEMLTDPEVARWNPAPAVVDLPSAAAWLARGADWDDGNHRTWTIADADDLFVGNVSLWDMDLTEHLYAGIGYRVHPGHRGHGIATTAVISASTWAIETLGIERIGLVHTIANVGSCSVAGKAGYVLEGILRDDFRTPDGQRWDSHQHSLLRRDLLG